MTRNLVTLLLLLTVLLAPILSRTAHAQGVREQPHLLKAAPVTHIQLQSGGVILFSPKDIAMLERIEARHRRPFFSVRPHGARKSHDEKKP